MRESQPAEFSEMKLDQSDQKKREIRGRNTEGEEQRKMKRLLPLGHVRCVSSIVRGEEGALGAGAQWGNWAAIWLDWASHGIGPWKRGSARVCTGRLLSLAQRGPGWLERRWTRPGSPRAALQAKNLK